MTDKLFPVTAPLSSDTCAAKLGLSSCKCCGVVVVHGRVAVDRRW